MSSSYNGWPAAADPNDIGVVKFSIRGTTPFANGGYAGGIKGGDVATVLGYVATRLDREVEPMMTDPKTGQLGYGCWGWQYRPNVNNPNVLSNHASGTAFDYNAPKHPNGSRNTFSSKQVFVIRSILSACQGSVQWGGDYRGVVDEMHFEINTTAPRLAVVAKSLSGGSGGGNEDDDVALSDSDLDKIADRVWNKIVTSRVSNQPINIGEMVRWIDANAQPEVIADLVIEKMMTMTTTSRVSKQPVGVIDMLTYIDLHTSPDAPKG